MIWENLKRKELARAVREELEWKEEQKKLHKKHEQIAEDVVILEKPHLVKFVIKKCCRKYSYLRYDTALYFGAIIGLTALFYPEVRQELLQVFFEILMEGKKRRSAWISNPGVQMDT